MTDCVFWAGSCVAFDGYRWPLVTHFRCGMAQHIALSCAAMDTTGHETMTFIMRHGLCRFSNILRLVWNTWGWTGIMGGLEIVMDWTLGTCQDEPEPGSQRQSCRLLREA